MPTGKHQGREKQLNRVLPGWKNHDLDPGKFRMYSIQTISNSFTSVFKFIERKDRCQNSIPLDHKK